MNNYFKKAIEFYDYGIKEYNTGLKERNDIKIREGCEKIFHSFVELSNGIISEHGYQIPKNHVMRSEILSSLGLGTLYDHVMKRLHDTCYYDGIIRKKYIEDAIEVVENEIKKRM
ncbi:MAG: hypothetical protein ACE5KT_08620 [Methanosarcinales archaeon]